MWQRNLAAASVLALLGVLLSSPPISFAADDNVVTRFVRFESGGEAAYGIVEENRIRKISGNLFGQWDKTDTTYNIRDVKILVPTRPTQVFAMAGNYTSHLGNTGVTTIKVTTVTTIVTDADTNETTSDSTSTTETRVSGEVPQKFRTPQPFYKSPSCLIAEGENIVIPAEAEIVHYEAELVVVIGKKARNVPKNEAMNYVLGVTCGNDISARLWQRGDVQWWRAKGADTFGPCGPFIVSGLDYGNLRMQLRLNGEGKQDTNTSQLIHDIPSTVSFISRHVTLHPGDLIFTGTPGKTSEIKPGDTVEVVIEGVGVLHNSVVAE